MAYIGRPSIVGNFVKLDAISVVNGQAAYTMQNGSVNFTDYSTVNQFLVSLNGTIQAPTDSFTVSGSTLTFASNLSTGDVIDFIMVFGNSLSAGTPTDATVTTAKLASDSVTSAKVADGVLQPPHRNIIINGDMQIAQRGTSFTSNGYTLDRFTMDESTDGAVTVTQDTDVPSGYGFAKSLKVDCTTADASIGAAQYCGFTQLIEGQNLQHLKYGTSFAETLTLSFWVKSVKTGTYCVRFVKEAGSGTRYETPIEYTISSASTWEKKTITLTPTAGSTSLITAANGAIANSNASGFRVFFTLVSGSNFHATNNTWVAGSDKLATSNQVNFLDNTSNNFWITGIQLEAGTSASDFEFVPYDVNLRRCKRYFEICGAAFTGGTSTTTNVDGSLQYSVNKRSDTGQSYSLERTTSALANPGIAGINAAAIAAVDSRRTNVGAYLSITVGATTADRKVSTYYQNWLKVDDEL